MTTPRPPRPFDAIRAALDHTATAAATEAGQTPSLRLDPDRRRRTGIPEVVLGGHKSVDELVDALERLVLTSPERRALASRCEPDTGRAVAERLADRYDVRRIERAGIVVVAARGAEPPRTGGRVGMLAAGSSDGAVATEAATMAEEMGCVVVQALDVGVAGLHRLVGPLEAMIAGGVDAIVVAAGMDGALPSVVAGLVDVPVIGLPTSVGYGAGGDGVGALYAMLQSCAPGLAVVNVDNGIGAGAMAALIANRAAAARTGVKAPDRANDGRG